VAARGHGDDPGAARGSQRRPEPQREREVTEMVGRELQLPAVVSTSLGRGHHSRVVHEDVEGPTPGADEPVDRLGVGELELGGVHGRISRARGDLRCDVCAGLRVSYRERYVGAGTC
jgi:hypothetical protein